MFDIIFNAFLSFRNNFGQFWVDTSQFKKCLYFGAQMYKMAEQTLRHDDIRI